MQQERLFLGGLNTDDSEELMSPEDWSHAENFMSGRAYQAKNGEGENVLGTTLLSSAVDLTGCKHIGTIRSAEDDVSYLFYYHATAANQCIVKFDSGTISLVLRWEGLNFSPLKAHRINGGGIAGDLLYFTDDFNEPRCVHITRYSDGSMPASEEEILHIRRGPTFAPEIDEASFANGTGKPLEDVQFAFQYQYKDGQLSVISPWTKLIRGYGMEGVTTYLSEVALRIHASEAVPALVDRVKFVARKGNNGVPFYWMDTNIMTQTTYSYVYTDQAIGVVPNIYLKPFELVPLKAKSACIAQSRFWFGNYVEGYDTPPKLNLVDSLKFSVLSVMDSGTADAGPTLSPNSKFRVGAVYHDGQGRSCGVIDGPHLNNDYWEFETTKVISEDATRKHLNYKIEGSGLLNIPSWAKYYSLVMTRDLIKTWFIQGSAFANDAVQPYAHVAGDGTETSSMTFDPANHEFLRLHIRVANLKGIYYSFKEGDYVMITNVTHGVTKGPLRVRKAEGIYVYVDSADMGNGGANFQYAFQIYTPNTNTEQIYYEIARRPITFPAGVPTLDTSTYSWDGDCVNRLMSSSDFMAQMRYNPQDGAWDTDSGKPYLVTPLGQVHKKNFIRCSSPFIDGINVNGLSEFNTGDEDNVPSEAVQVQKLQPTSLESSGGDVILAICNSDTYSVYVGESRMSTNDGTSLIINSVKVIGDVRKHATGFGTLHPESVFVEGGEVCWYDHLMRSYVRYATNGIFPISEYKAVNYFEKQASLNTKDDVVVSGYDPFYKMVTVTFTNADTTVKKTIAFSTTKNRWITFLNFAPDGYIIGSKKMYSIKGASLYSHDDAANFNRFYGVNYSSKVRVSMNDAPGDPKEWRVAQIQCSPNFFSWSNAEQVVGVNALRVDASNRNGQETSILYNEFDVDEYLAYGEIKGDENTGTVLSGDPMYSNTLQLDVTFSGGSYKQITMVKAGCELSRGHVL